MKIFASQQININTDYCWDFLHSKGTSSLFLSFLRHFWNPHSHSIERLLTSNQIYLDLVQNKTEDIMKSTTPSAHNSILNDFHVIFLDNYYKIITGNSYSWFIIHFYETFSPNFYWNNGLPFIFCFVLNYWLWSSCTKYILEWINTFSSTWKHVARKSKALSKKNIKAIQSRTAEIELYPAVG